MDMNTKPVQAALAAARGAAPELVAISQPAVPPGMTLLGAAQLVGAVRLDMYGYADEADGCSVEAVTVAGETTNIVEFFSHAELSRMSAKLDTKFLAERAAAAGEAKAVGAQLDRAAL